jgi:GNAT superfamily N-acetyltransferase
MAASSPGAAARSNAAATVPAVPELPPVVLTAEPYDSPDAHALVEAMWRDLAGRYGAAPEEGDDWRGEVVPADVVPPAGTFLVARIDGVPVGCGGVRRLDATTGEVKRMYTAPEGRRRGVGRTVLAELERWARDAGLTELRLETGVPQPEAIALYEGAGYRRIAGYGHYRGAPGNVCFAKEL